MAPGPGRGLSLGDRCRGVCYEPLRGRRGGPPEAPERPEGTEEEDERPEEEGPRGAPGGLFISWKQW
ncbi:MAG: hypothetical protein HY909_12715 [Deltaproteobacteria bacterium]|nr:hypothetical protein [Deltaproteobacteria bacterium]